jgi:hypothetical protein
VLLNATAPIGETALGMIHPVPRRLIYHSIPLKLLIIFVSVPLNLIFIIGNGGTIATAFKAVCIPHTNDNNDDC